MHFDYSPEHYDLQTTVRAFLDRTVPLTSLPPLVETESGEDEKMWSAAVEQLGLPGLEVDEDHGGAGADAVSVTLVLTQLGAAMPPGPLAPCIGLAVPLLNELPHSPMRSSLLAGIASGDVVPGLDHQLFVAEPQPSTVIASRRDGTDVDLIGAAARVIVGSTATDLLVLAQLDGDPAVVHVRSTEEGVVRTTQATLDPARREARIDFEAAAGVVLAVGADAVTAHAAGHRRALLFAACEALGGSERALDIAVQYAKDRRAFGQVIGTFQALKHRMATQHVENELARTMLMYVAWSLTAPVEDVDPTALEQAKLAACDAYLDTARVAVGILGGTGYTWEHPIQLFFKRATVLRQQFARPADLRAVIAKSVIQRLAVQFATPTGTPAPTREDA